MNWRKSVILKKLRRYVYATYRRPYKLFISHNEHDTQPAIIANSFPKSGTHLLIQILQAIPKLREWGSFFASMPSFTYREKSISKIHNSISCMVPKELVCGHLFFSPRIENALNQNRAIHYFIYRDLRDVAISEAYYLTYMNKWHGLHRHYKSLPDISSRILFSIKGATESSFPYDYPDIGQRFSRYKPWIYSPHSHAIRFEDLTSGEKTKSIHSIFKYYSRRSCNAIDHEELVHQALQNINPAKSPTFRKGRPDAWKEVFTETHKTEFKKVAGEQLIELGYEANHNW